jgi:predicted SPOUT superfamily RNA methylase MTH1
MPNLWVAIPDSAISEEQTARDKNLKIANFARACSIFRVKTIFIYHDSLSKSQKDDFKLIKIILQFLDTPQYLRRYLYPHMDELKYAGILPPIQTPHHKAKENLKYIRVGDVRVAVIVKVKGQYFAEVGLDFPVPFAGSAHEGEKINVKFISAYPNLKAIKARDADIKEYWGYEVKEVMSLSKLITAIENTQVIITSRKGTYFRKVETKLLERIKNAKNLLIIFGAPRHGVQEILFKEGFNLKSVEFIVNMFPDQGTETVRLEEAIIGTLAILNHSFGTTKLN